jgi:hypothetical protein
MVDGAPPIIAPVPSHVLSVPEAAAWLVDAGGAGEPPELESAGCTRPTV